MLVVAYFISMFVMQVVWKSIDKQLLRIFRHLLLRTIKRSEDEGNMVWSVIFWWSKIDRKRRKENK